MPPRKAWQRQRIGFNQGWVGPGDGNKARQIEEIGIKQEVIITMYMESKLQKVGNKLKRAL